MHGSSRSITRLAAVVAAGVALTLGSATAALAADIVEQGGIEAWSRVTAEQILGAEDAPRYTKSSDILEVWFDSGSTFFHVLRGSHAAESTYPADLYLEGSVGGGCIGQIGLEVYLIELALVLIIQPVKKLIKDFFLGFT